MNEQGSHQEPLRTFEGLDCWKACRQLRLFVSGTVQPPLPKDEKHRLADQLIRAARSTTANIAEGHGRYHHADNAKFVGISRGSCYEVLDHLITAADEGMIDPAMLAEGRVLIEQAIRPINGYMTYLRKAR